MKLPFSLPFGKKEKPDLFLALLLRDGRVVAVIFEEFLGKVRIVGKHEEYFETSIEEASLDELLDVTDKAISIIEAGVPGEETQKTVFGIKENWVQDSRIKREYLVKLKRLSESLGLAPIGFLVIHEAIAHLIQQEEGAPPSALLVEVDKQNITVSLLRAGRITETRSTKIEDSIPQATDRILHHFTNYEVLPSRIIVFDSENNEELVQEFIAHSWSKSLPFLHVPQITTLPNGFDAKAVLFGAAREMGFELLEEEKASGDQEQEEIKIEDFGFVKEEDVAQRITVEAIEEPQKFISKEKKEKITVFLKKIINIFSMFISKISIKNVSLPTLPIFRGGKKLIFIPPLIVGVFTFILLGYIFGLGATVILTVTPKTLEQDQEVTFSTVSSTNLTQGIIKGEFVSVSEEGTISTLVTGKKEVGDKARGTVTLYNKTSETKTFPSGTVIVSSNKLEFSLDSSVTVASASGDIFSPTTPGTIKVSVTALQIGKESNLPSGTTFSIGSLTNVAAKNDTAFSGGTKREIIVVAKEDLDKLTEELPKNLETKAKEEMAKKIAKERTLIPIFISTTLSKKEFNKKLGEEAKTITLKATVTYQGISYSKDDLDAFSKSLLKNRLPNDLTLSEKGITSELQKLKEKNEKEVLATLKLTAPFVPKLNSGEIASNLTSKSFTEAKAILSKLPQVSDIKISLSPAIPFLPKILPYQNKNITITLITK